MLSSWIPLKFVENKSQLMGACRGYKDINMLAIQLLNPGGFCFRRISADP